MPGSVCALLFSKVVRGVKQLGRGFRWEGVGLGRRSRRRGYLRREEPSPDMRLILLSRERFLFYFILNGHGLGGG